MIRRGVEPGPNASIWESGMVQDDEGSKESSDVVDIGGSCRRGDHYAEELVKSS